MDWTPHQRAMLRHCLLLASVDQDYALWASARYERESFGVLDGLHAKVLTAIEKHKRATANTEESHADREQ